MKVKVTYKNEISNESGFESKEALVEFLAELDMGDCKIRDFLFVDMGEDTYVVKGSRDELVDKFECSFWSVADFLETKYDLNSLMKSEIQAIRVSKMEFIF